MGFFKQARAPTLFVQYLGACRRRTPRTRIDLKVPTDASHRGLSDATLRFDPAFGIRRRHAPERDLKMRSTSVRWRSSSRQVHRYVSVHGASVEASVWHVYGDAFRHVHGHVYGHVRCHSSRRRARTRPCLRTCPRTCLHPGRLTNRRAPAAPGHSDARRCRRRAQGITPATAGRRQFGACAVPE